MTIPGADDETRTHTTEVTTPSRWRVYQFHHVGITTLGRRANRGMQQYSFSRHRFQTRLPGNILRLRIRIRRDLALLDTTRRWRWNRRRSYRILHHTASRFWCARCQIRQRQAGHKEDRGQHRGGATKEIGGTGRAKKAARRATAKSSTHVSTFTVLHQDETDHAHCCQEVHRQNHRKKIFHITSSSTRRTAAPRPEKLW